MIMKDVRSLDLFDLEQMMKKSISSKELTWLTDEINRRSELILKDILTIMKFDSLLIDPKHSCSG